MKTKKINLLGDGGVGKTSLVIRYVKGIFDERYLKTIGINVYSKKVGEIELQIYDIMGQSGYDSVRRLAIQNSSGALAVCDITRKDTLENLVGWIEGYRKIVGDRPIVIAVNKIDLPKNEWEFDVPEIEKIVNELGVGYILTSAKENKNVDNAFIHLAEKAIYSPTEKDSKKILKILKEKEFKTPKDLLDGIIAGFLIYYKVPIGENILRQQLKVSGIDLDNVTIDGVKIVTEKLGKALKNFSSEEDYYMFKTFVSSIMSRYKNVS